MNNFKVYANDLQFKACKCPYKLLWTGVTYVAAVDFPDIPNTRFFFKDVAEIQAGNFHVYQVMIYDFRFCTMRKARLFAAPRAIFIRKLQENGRK